MKDCFAVHTPRECEEPDAQPSAELCCFSASVSLPSLRLHLGREGASGYPIAPVDPFQPFLSTQSTSLRFFQGGRRPWTASS